MSILIGQGSIGIKNDLQKKNNILHMKEKENTSKKFNTLFFNLY